MILGLAAELERARPVPPFANGSEGEAWLANWCDRCAREADCNLVLVSLLDRTPAAWKPDRPRSLGQQYYCLQFQESTCPR